MHSNRVDPKIRLRAVQMILAGERKKKVIEKFKVGYAQLAKWVRDYQKKGVAGLAYKKRISHVLTISEKHWEILKKIIKGLPGDYGVKADEWTVAAIRNVVHEKTGDWLRGHHLYSALKKIGFTFS